MLSIYMLPSLIREQYIFPNFFHIVCIHPVIVNLGVIFHRNQTDNFHFFDCAYKLQPCTSLQVCPME